jgi:hypothetical protein
LAAPSGAAKDSFPRSFSPETATGFTNTFSTKEPLSPKCPEALAATPGSDPASKVLNNALNTADSFKPGGTVHYTYLDNPHTNGGTQNFTIQDCVVVYPAGFFTAGDFDPDTGVLTSTALSKHDLSKGGTQIDGASLSGINSSVGNIYFAWTSPQSVAPGSWVCNFARDIANNHGGAGNRKVPPTCYKVPGASGTTTSSSTSSSTSTTVKPFTNVTPDILLGYADELHDVAFTPTPWAGDPGIHYLGCVDGSAGCTAFDAGAIRVDNPITNGPLTLTGAFVTVTGVNGSCVFQPWGAFLPETAGAGESFVLTQTGTLGPPQPAQCSGSIDPPLWPITNFDTSEAPGDVIDRTTNPVTIAINCPPNPPSDDVITLQFQNSFGTYTLTVTDADRILTTGGYDRSGCTNQDEATPWTPVAPSNVVRNP